VEAPVAALSSFALERSVVQGPSMPMVWMEMTPRTMVPAVVVLVEV
jgi:hypothetical protein